MSSWWCTTCRTTYAVGVPSCPHCGSTDYSDGEGGTVAKASAEGGATHYLAEGDPVPGDLPEGVRLVGPGAPDEVAPVDGEDAGQAPEAEAPADEAIAEPGNAADDDGQDEQGDDEQDGPADYGAYRIADLRDLARERGITIKASAAKADLVDALKLWDADHPYGS